MQLSYRVFKYILHFFELMCSVQSITELRENEMSVVVLERKSIAAIKTGAPRLL